MGFYNDKKVGDPKWIAGDEEHDAALAESGISVEAACRIKGWPVRWLVENIIPLDGVTVIAGEPGAGKTFFACQLAADAARVAQLRVVLATSGYEPPELLRWRLDRADADTRRIALATLTPKGMNDRRATPTEESIDERMAILYHTLLGAGDPKSGLLPAQINVPDDSLPTPRAASLLVIDDIDGWFGQTGMMLPAAALARVIQRLNELAHELHVAIVVLVRTQMSVEGRITSRQLSRLTQAASVVWMVVKDRERAEERGQVAETEGNAEGGRQKAEATDGGQRTTDVPAYIQNVRRWFLPVKNNPAPASASYGRTFELLDGQIRWHADDAAPSLAEATLPSAHNSDRRRERRAAMAWIEEALAAGPLPSEEFFQQGAKSGYSKGTLRRAATELGIHSHKTGFNGGWEMRWVPQPVVRGQGKTATLAGAGFRIVSCAPSQKNEELESANCASSIRPDEAGSGTGRCAGTNRPHPGPLPKGEGEEASCASSVEPEKHDATSCASSAEPEESRDVSCAPSVQDIIVDALQECLREAS